MLKTFLILLFITALSFLTGCEKTVTGNDLNGEWVSDTMRDTLYFNDDSNFFHSSENMRYDHYEYSVQGDSLEIGYGGMMMVLVKKTKHRFKLDGDDLMIDFSNEFCFGFPKEKIMYRRIQKLLPE